MLKNDRGITLIELVVAFAISAIIIGIISLSVFPSYSAAAKHCATQTDSLLSKCRLGCLSRTGNVHLTLRRDQSGNIIGDYYEAAGTPVSSDILSDKKVILTYTLKSSDGSLRNINLSDAPLSLSFDRSTGAFKAQSDGSYCTAVSFSCGGRTFILTLVPTTGVFSLT